MDIRDIISQIKALTDELTKAIDERREQNKNLRDKATDIRRDYFDDVAKKERIIKEQVRGFELEKQKISAEIKGIQPHLVNATVSGNAKDIKNIQEHLAELKANEEALNEQIILLETATIKGDEKLYDEFQKQCKLIDQDNETLGDLFEEAGDFACEQQRYWEKLSGKILYTNRLPYREYGRTVAEHFNCEPDPPKSKSSCSGTR